MKIAHLAEVSGVTPFNPKTSQRSASAPSQGATGGVVSKNPGKEQKLFKEKGGFLAGFPLILKRSIYMNVYIILKQYLNLGKGFWICQRYLGSACS